MTRPLAAGALFGSVATAVGLTLSSPSTALIAALDKVTNDTFDGITPPLAYTLGKPTHVACSFDASVSGSKRTGRTA